MTDKLIYILIAMTAVLIFIGAVILSRLKSVPSSGNVLDRLDGISKTVSDEFSRSRTENAGEQRSQRLELTAALNDMRKSSVEQSEKQTAAIQQAVEKMQQSNEQRLEQMRQTVDEKLSTTLTARLDSSFKAVSEQLENVYRSLGEMKVLSTGVTDNVTSLNRILTNVKARGTWAEVQLEGLLNQTIPGMFDRNVVTNPATKELVEFAVRIPSSENKDIITYMPIDSKFPVEDYVRLCAAGDSGDQNAVNEYRKALERRVLTFAKDVSKYINEPTTTPFAIMYLATEGLYSEIIGSASGVAERIQNEYSVMIAGPGTITALLNSLSMGFRAMAINEKTKEVRALLAAAKVQYDKFGEVLEKARKKIEEAGRSLDEAQSRNTIIRKKLKGVEEMDSLAAGELLGIEDAEDN